MGPHRIILTKDVAGVQLDLGKGVLCIRHPSYAQPDIDGTHITLLEAEASIRDHLDGCKTIVFVGLNKSKTPSSRTKYIWEILYYELAHLNKVSIDTTLFVSRPWRTWFHFGFVGAKYREYTYSYIAESMWSGWRDGIQEENPFSDAEVIKWGRRIIRSDYKIFHRDVSSLVVPMGASVHAEYQELKGTCFEEERTLAQIVRRLSKFAKEALPERNVPARSRLFVKDALSFTMTDLPVDLFLWKEASDMIDSVNAIGSKFYGC